MERPSPEQYNDPVDFMKDMLAFRKATEKGFSIYSSTQTLNKVSPALVTLILQRKRKITFDRTEALSKLLGLNSSEKYYFRNWIGRLENKEIIETPVEVQKKRKNVSLSILNDWVNVYTKDLFQIAAIRKNPTLIQQQFHGTVSGRRIEKAIEFLMREGHLRRTLTGEIVLETNLAVADPGVPSQKIRQFHKAAFDLAKRALDLVAPSERRANTLIIPLNEQGFTELNSILNQFAERLQEFAANQQSDADRLYQLIINLSPIGGKLE